MRQLDFSMCDMLRQAAGVIETAVNQNDDKVKQALADGAAGIVKNVLDLLTGEPKKKNNTTGQRKAVKERLASVKPLNHDWSA